MERRDFHNRHDFFILVAAMVVWTVHFTVLWVASSAFPADPAARWIAYAATVAALGALWWLYIRAGRPALASVSGLSLALATVGTLYDVLPAILS